ncbi:MAG TPA: hypothetical protein VMR54_04405 [Thermoanaerobaculia bacterium]|nr:hypothetical protein [Thermoanaerobaculia bacterium]
MPRARFAEILRLLAENEVEFVVVGMTAGILHGAPVTTVDLDLVHRRSPDNVRRLLRVLGEIDATYRHDPRGLRPAESHLAGPGHQLLTTRLGDLDCLGAIDQDRRYEDLLPLTVEMALSEGRSVHVLSLPALIEAKERAGRPKDLAALPVLRATLDELKRRS